MPYPYWSIIFFYPLNHKIGLSLEMDVFLRVSAIEIALPVTELNSVCARGTFWRGKSEFESFACRIVKYDSNSTL